MEHNFVIREIAHFHLFLAVPPELELLSLVLCILIVYTGSKHGHVMDLNLKNFVSISWI
jgi:hypothetical protein